MHLYFRLGGAITPKFPLKYTKVYLGNSLVKISAIFSFVDTYSNLTSFSFTFSLRKWNLIDMFLVFECNIRFFELLIALELSKNMAIGSS
jgi:hypothetical protein